MTRISLIATVKNEADNIAALLDSMLAQTRPPDEIVINDNWSTDATPAIVEQYIAQGHPIRLVRGGYNIPSGRNHAIQHAHGSVIASCDAGLRLPSHWLQAITAPLVGGTADLVGGFYVPDAHSRWEFALGATNYPDVDEVDPATFLPAGQSVAFTKAAWAQVGGYPEWADTCEDLIFDQAVQRAGLRVAFVPEAAVLFRPRSTVRAYLRQYFTYARGDGVANLWPRRHAIRYSFYGGLLGLAWLSQRGPRWLILLGLPLFGLHVAKPMRRVWRRSQDRVWWERWALVALVPLIRLLGDAAKMVGYPVGWWRRLTRAVPSQARSEERQ